MTVNRWTRRCCPFGWAIEMFISN